MPERIGIIEYTCVGCLSKSDVTLDLHYDDMTYIECDCGERCAPSESSEIKELLTAHGQ